MTTKYLTGAYPGGYTLKANYKSLVIEASASVGGNGVMVGFKATITNLGMIKPTGQTGVELLAGGTLINGSVTDTTAVIDYSGRYAVETGYGAAGITNFGTMGSIVLAFGGTVTNGSNADTSARIGGQGVRAFSGAAATITNFAIMSYAALQGGGTVINGSATDTVAKIQAISSNNGAGSRYNKSANVTNFGTIQDAGGGADGVFLGAGGTVTNGTTADTSALISQVRTSYVAATVSNFGTIQTSKFAGVFMTHGGSVTNGQASDTSALIKGDYGVYANQTSPTVVTNYGTIDGVGGVAVYLANAADRLVVEQGAVFVGAVQAAGGELFFASGAGTISGLGAEFTGFATYGVETGGTWTLSGANAVGGGDKLTDGGSVNQLGTLTIGDATPNAASLTISGTGTWNMSGAATIATGSGSTSTLMNAGTLIGSGSSGANVVGLATIDTGLIEAAAGTLEFTQALTGTGVLKVDAGATLKVNSSVAKTLSMTFNGPSATLAIKSRKTFNATINGLAPTDTIDLLNIRATGASVNGQDQLVIVRGTRTVATLQLTGSYSGATFSVGSDGNGGSDIVMLTAAAEPPFVAPAAPRSTNAFVAAMAGLGARATTSNFETHAEVPRALLIAARVNSA